MIVKCKSCGDSKDPANTGLGVSDLGTPGGLGGCGDCHDFQEYECGGFKYSGTCDLYGSTSKCDCT